ncbi:BREX-1 system phosphatase PglZ type A [uncultured Endozoicomonas sp.]|uniref:BREX-1 system phosphatase PglZ type A n=1 Tax=uncultured Endozoicomonas sp. TaxID=432652 RepID=UPI00262493DB|nr:BREX-1 system phosphatase PglZ type A [uncultured Endozoicomonas sp.]
MSKIQEALQKRFQTHRIVFWYDAQKELRQDFETVDLPGVEKVELRDNEFALKYRLLRSEPEQKFLLYREGSEPGYRDNWLLDVQLANNEFRTDQASLWLSELELGLEFSELVQKYPLFFEAKSRLIALKKILGDRDSHSQIELKMLSVCASSEPRIDAILEALLQELARGKEDKAKLLTRCQLDTLLWKQLERHYGYHSEAPGIHDFAIELFKSCFAMAIGGSVQLSSEALVFLKRWKDSRRYGDAFETLSAQSAAILQMEQKLSAIDFRQLMDVDYFELIDQKLLSEMVHGVTERSITSGELSNWVRQRRQSHWHDKYQHIYAAVDYAAQFMSKLDNSLLTMDANNETMAEGIKKYTDQWCQLDQFYRKFIWHKRQSAEATLLNELNTQIENLYTNNYLLPVNNSWQAVVDKSHRWAASPVMSQQHFWRNKVKPFLSKKDRKVCVIISDALRYEIGHELLGLIRREDRFDAELTPALSTLPSYTQLGMAALLPHQTLALADDTTSTVLVDGISSRGTDYRRKILDAGHPGKASAVLAKDLMSMDRDQSRELMKANDALYIYHNLIDKTGDSKDSEERVFNAAEDTLKELLLLVKKLTNANVYNILITADHGFIYQDRALDDSEFSSSVPEGDTILYRDRRFILGKGLKPAAGLSHYSSESLGLGGDMEIQIPKSINRLRLSGSGSRFVHGGSTLQEVVVPVIKINKKRKSDISSVGVQIHPAVSKMITSGQLTVRLYQQDPVTDKVQSRNLRVGIYTLAGELISDSHDLQFDMTSENPRDRELQIQLVLSHEADKANNQEVVLRLDEKHASTTHYQEYQAVRFQLRRSFTSDFDF